MSKLTAFLILAVVTSELIVSDVSADPTASYENSSEHDMVSAEDYADGTANEEYSAEEYSEEFADPTTDQPLSSTEISSEEDDYDGSPQELQLIPQQGNSLVAKQTMELPHCGNAENELSGDAKKWSKKTLTYRIRAKAAGARPSIVSAFISRAFNEWSKVTNMDFIEKNDPNVDIEINFGGMIHLERGGICIFNRLTVTAHASNRYIHFHSRYYFPNGEDMDRFLDTTIHEIGHSLGLEHSSSLASIMYPTTAKPLFGKPQPEDVKRIQALYGVRNTPKAPKFCSLRKFDAAVDDEDGYRYLFSGNYYYRDDSRAPIGRLISSKWPGIAGSIDAAHRSKYGYTYFFKGNQYWRYEGTELDPGFPRLISKGFPGFPNSIDAFFRDSNGRQNAVKGSRIWIRFGDSARSYNLRSKGLPSGVDAALNKGSALIVFKGRDYYRLWKGVFRRYTDKRLNC